MGRAALFPCCANEPLLDSAQVVSQPSPKPAGKKGEAQGRKPPPPPIVPTRDPPQARSKAGSGRRLSVADSSPATPLKRSGSMKGKRSSERHEVNKELLPTQNKTSPKASSAPSPKPSTPNKGTSKERAGTSPAPEALAGSHVKQIDQQAFKLPEPEPDTPVSPTTPQAGKIAKSDRAQRRRSTSTEHPKGPVEPPCLGGTWSEPKLVRAPIVESGSQGEPWIHESDFVMLRPLPYEPIPWDLGDNNRPRTFVYKGALIQIPLLALPDGENGSTGTGSVKPGKKDDQLRQNKGWKVVKSKVVGGGVKAT
eukprot:TRINITY_DN103549_c0_g1_i1.p1 TRINITY_DN103549_c0_g1~~TRINITY_DN103549_c0_g1_i1.p1  ORF type:complete len:309 (-),score=44.56 TRINITY_DN103549_c0_g1_i1:107-1033(-)